MGIKMISQILSEDIPPIKWLVEDLIPEQGVTILGGDSGSLKTFFSIYLGLCCVSGKKVLDKYETKKIKVLYLDEENRVIILKDRLIKLLKGLEIEEKELDMGFLISSNMKLDRIKKGAEFEKIIKDFKPDLIIVDAMVGFFSGEENNSKDVRNVFSRIKPLIEKYKTSFLLLHHTRKTNWTKVKDDLRGSGDFGAFADVILMINEIGSNSYMLSQPKNRLQRRVEGRIKISIIDAGDSGLKIIHSGESSVRVSKNVNEVCADKILEWIIKENMKNFKTGDVRKSLKTKKNETNDGLHSLEIQGKIKHISRGNWEVI